MEKHDLPREKMIGDLQLHENDRAILYNPQAGERGEQRKRQIIQAILEQVRKTHEKNRLQLPRGYYTSLESVMRSQPRLIGDFVEAYIRDNEIACKRIRQILNEGALAALPSNINLPNVLRERTRSSLATIMEMSGESVEHEAVRRRYELYRPEEGADSDKKAA